MPSWTKLSYYAAILSGIFFFSAALYFADKMFQLSRQEVDKSVPEYRHHFVLVPEEVDNDYWRLVEQGARAAARNHGVLLEYAGPKQANVEEHLKRLEISAAASVDGVMTQGLNENQFTPIINKLMEKGIPVVTVDTDAPGSNRIAYIGTDNYYSGFIAGKALLAGTAGPTYVGIITGGFQSAHQQLRVQGFKDAVAEESRIVITAVEESRITRINAAEMANKILTEHPETNAFFGTSALDGIGIAEAVLQANRALDTYIIAFDSISETVDYIQRGIIQATVIQKPYDIGYKAVETMAAIREGKKVPELNFTETKVLYREDLHSMPEALFGGEGR
ncbi:MAG TPA: sugar-binding protein [Bacillaceae bacterium]